MAKHEVTTRIAPSPTGPLHVGTARVALFNELFARKTGGSFVVRIEDTDKERSEEKYVQDIIDGLTWLGIEWDGEIARQSERGDLYEAAIKRLLDNGAAYQEKGSQAVKFKVEEEEVSFNDLIRGEIKVPTDMWGGDFIIARTPQDPLYHLAVVVDDAAMGISHVIRGEDHISNTPRHILLQRALGYQEPQWAHLPLLLNEQRRKLSKRDGAVSLLKYHKDGYLPEALLNYLALLGWNPGDDREFFTHEELIDVFELKKVQKGGAVFCLSKLAAINKHYLRKLSGQELLTQVRPYLDETEIKGLDDAYLAAALATEQERVSTLGEFKAAIQFFLPQWKGEYELELLVWRGSTKEAAEALLQKLEQKLDVTPETDFNKEKLERELLQWIDEEKLGRGDVLWPMRVALTGQANSPGPFEVAAVLGKEETRRRLVKALDKLS
ncbi:MAG: glutamate--tRNA ligase [bacterium]